MRQILVFSIALSTACGVATPDFSTVEFKGMPIFGGTLPDDARYDAVVGILITEKNSTYICSGTLIAPDVVLSAGHCVVGTRGKRTKVAAPGDLEVILGATLYGPSLAVSQVEPHPGYNPFDYGVNDLSLLRLAEPQSIAPLAWLPSSMAANEVIGTPVRFAGYGRTETGDIGTKLWVDGAISDVTATGLRNEQDDVTGTCGGDSGGPLIYDFDGTWYVGGTTSWGDANCTDYGWSMRVSAYDNWIDGFVNTAPECIADADCDDNDTCTDDSCESGECVYVDNGTCGGGDCAGKKEACSIDADCCSNHCVRNICR